MKKTILILLAALLTVLCVSSVSAASASTILSPALEVISSKIIMVKSGLVAGSITFSKEDFNKGVGCAVDSITLTSLPDPSDGVLLYNGSAVAINQTISSKGLDALKYVPTNSSDPSSFKFRTSGEYSIECSIRYTDTLNLAPTAGLTADSVSVWTQTDITAFGKLSASDPEGDAMTFEIVQYPTKGILELRDAMTGDYTYTPCANVTGKDSFTYAAVDEWGHYSEECSVIVDIEKAASDISFADMDGHWAHNAAIVMAAENAMETEEVDGKILFNPDENITREDFLVTVMKILGAGDIPPAETVFADNDEISEDASGYVARAYSLGVISGEEIDGLSYFKPSSTVSRAQAAVILNTIIGAEEPDTVPVFADGDSVPTWARGALYALTSEGILNGNGEGYISPNAPLSRAQAAQIFLKVKKLYS